MKGDRVKIVSSTIFETVDETLPVYVPIVGNDGRLQTTYDGLVVVKHVGGVKAGSTGVIYGDPIRVNKLQMLHMQSNNISNGNEFIILLPIFLDTYQQVGWFPVDHVKVISGGILT